MLPSCQHFDRMPRTRKSFFVRLFGASKLLKVINCLRLSHVIQLGNPIKEELTLHSSQSCIVFYRLIIVTCEDYQKLGTGVLLFPPSSFAKERNENCSLW